MTIAAAFGPELTEPYTAPMHHGHGERKDEHPVDRDRFFRPGDPRASLPGRRPAAIVPYFEERLRALIGAYGEAGGHGRASVRLEEIAAALAEGWVGTPLLEANRRISGSIDAAAGTVLPYLQEPQRNGAANAGAADVLDELAEAALRERGPK